jgi:hypothetical protein
MLYYVLIHSLSILYYYNRIFAFSSTVISFVLCPKALIGPLFTRLLAPPLRTSQSSCAIMHGDTAIFQAPIKREEKKKSKADHAIVLAPGDKA